MIQQCFVPSTSIERETRQIIAESTTPFRLFYTARKHGSHFAAIFLDKYACTTKPPSHGICQWLQQVRTIRLVKTFVHLDCFASLKEVTEYFNNCILN